MENIISDQTIILSSKEQVSCNLGNEEVILNFKDGVYYGLDSIGVFIWDQAQKSKTVKEICDSVLEVYDVESKCCEQDVRKLLQELLEKGLIQIKNEVTA